MCAYARYMQRPPWDTPAPPTAITTMEWSHWVAGCWTSQYDQRHHECLMCMFSFSLEWDNLIQGISTEFNYSWTMRWWTRAYKSVGPTCLFITSTIYGKCVTAGRDEPVKGCRLLLRVCAAVADSPVVLRVSSVWSRLNWALKDCLNLSEMI